MFNKILLTLLTISCSLLTVEAQVTQQWVQRYNGPGNSQDGGSSLAVDGSGNVYVTGSSNNDYATLKYNSSGVQQWVARYNGPGNSIDGAGSLAVDVLGNVYVTGSSYGSGTDFDYATLKYNSSGVQQWVARYNGPGNSFDRASSLAVDGSGNVYVTGYSNGSGTMSDYATIKYNSAGDSVWVRRYNGPGNNEDNAYSIAVDGSGNVYVTGYSAGSGAMSDYITIKYNSLGVQLWEARYNGPENDYDGATSLAVDGPGNVYVTGWSEGSGTMNDYATIKYNSAGDSVWVRRYNGPGNYVDIAYSIALDGSGNVYVTGKSGGDYATLKYNSSGDSVWVARYNGPGNSVDEAYSLAVDGLGNVYVTGTSYGSGTFQDYATLKYNSAGVQQWLQRYNGPGNNYDEAYSLAVDGSGNVYVTGWSEGSGTELDYATIKYFQLVGITPISNEIPETFCLEQNYPNPFNPSTKIKFDVPLSPRSPRESGERGVGGFVSLIVYDILGQEVATLVNEQLNPGIYEVEWNASNYPSGIYYYKLTSGDGAFSATRKAVLIK